MHIHSARRRCRWLRRYRHDALAIRACILSELILSPGTGSWTQLHMHCDDMSFGPLFFSFLFSSSIALTVWSGAVCMCFLCRGEFARSIVSVLNNNFHMCMRRTSIFNSMYEINFNSVSLFAGAALCYTAECVCNAISSYFHLRKWVQWRALAHCHH